MNRYQIIKKPLRTEKGVADVQSSNTYHFEVDMKANKIQIKDAIEKFFNVKVADIRTQVRKGKNRRVKFKQGRTKDWKKAIVMLKEGSTIDLGY
ncbi:MAG: 50S ribosomal protein L23 [Planctomycetes bacterium RIFCSPHIGHO2_02_FULL_38_41]|nr:MAG: 50S ribosomal protein L23 [Planctomycetes bacterium RIFCSPHIGHO2_02_FULL_38_41]OHB97872.1 MAG: 50S ribosomal protein L23 [Planctomycetes bacterium RIFCSPLOWO2_12_38_17]